jgi:hypothetical protein
MLTLGTTLDASPVQLAREAEALGNVHSLVKRGQRGDLQPSV